MKEGFWTLKEAMEFNIKEYDAQKNSYLLFKKITGPYYLINEKVLNLLKELYKPHSTSALHEKMKNFGIAQNKSAEVLVTLETIGVISYTHAPPKENGRLHFFESMSTIIPRKLFRFILFFSLGLLSIVFIHFSYLIITQFSLITSVSRSPAIEDYVLFFLLSVIFTILHEIAHGVIHYLSCGKLPKPVSLKPMGQMFFLPVPKVNLNITYLLNSRMQRVAILGAGLFVDFLLLWFSFLMVKFTGQTPFWVYLTWISFISFVLNLVPLWNSDGYYILSEVVGVPNLSFYARDALKRLIKRKGDYSLILAFYGASKVVFEIAFFVLFLVIWYKLACLAGIFGKYLFWSIFVVIFFVKSFKGFMKHRKGGQHESS